MTHFMHRGWVPPVFVVTLYSTESFKVVHGYLIYNETVFNAQISCVGAYHQDITLIARCA